MKKRRDDRRRLSLQKDYVRVLTAMDLAQLRGGMLSCSIDDGCGGASTATSYACGGE